MGRLGLIRHGCRRAIAPFARRRLRRMVAEGLPAALVEPLNYLITARLTPEDERLADRVERLRADLARRTDAPPQLYGVSSDACDDTDGRVVRGPLVRVSWPSLASVTSVTPYWGGFLFLCAKTSGARTILELGGAVGMSGCYLASAPTCERFVNIEGSIEAARVSGANLQQIAPHAHTVNALFDEGLNRVLPELGGVDFVHLDGQHEEAATVHLFERVRPHLRPGAFVVYDDIHWCAGMERAWRTLSQRRGVAAAVNAGRCGVCLWNGADAQPRVFDFSRYSSHWRKGQPDPQSDQR